MPPSTLALSVNTCSLTSCVAAQYFHRARQQGRVGTGSVLTATQTAGAVVQLCRPQCHGLGSDLMTAPWLLAAPGWALTSARGPAAAGGPQPSSSRGAEPGCCMCYSGPLFAEASVLCCPAVPCAALCCAVLCCVASTGTAGACHRCQPATAAAAAAAAGVWRQQQQQQRQQHASAGLTSSSGGGGCSSSS
jgi:hypothetical protein